MNLEEVKEEFCRPVDERAILSFALNDINYFYSVCSKLSDGDFLHSHHQLIFMIMKTLLDRGVKSLDLAALNAEAQAEGVFHNIGGYDYVLSINNMMLSKENFDVYLNNVIEASTKFKLYLKIHNGLDAILTNSKNGLSSADLMGDIESSVLDLSTESKSIEEPKNIADGLREYIEEKSENKVEMMGISTGYPILDKQIDGLVPGTLLIVSARKKMGKSTFLSNIAAHVAIIDRVPTLYIDTEMSFVEWRDRIVSHMSNVPERVVKHGGYTPEDKAKIMKCVDRIEGSKLFHEFMPGYSLDKIVTLYKKYKAVHNIGLGIFDYLKEPDSSTLDRQRKEYQVLGDVTTKLKDLAGILNIPFATAVQINRSGDIADSDRVARYGDVVAQWMLKDEEEYNHGGEKGGRYKLVIRDSRRGGATPKEGIGYWFFKEQLSIKEVDAANQLVNSFGDRVINFGSDSFSDDKELK